MVPESASQVAEGRAPQGRAEKTRGTGAGRRHRKAGLQGNDGGARRRDGQGTAQTDIICVTGAATVLKQTYSVDRYGD